jgi:hypothetical protein
MSAAMKIMRLVGMVLPRYISSWQKNYKV